MKKIKNILVIMAIALVTIPSAWAAFPVNAPKTVQTQSGKSATATAETAPNQTKAEAKKATKKQLRAAQKSYWEKLRAGGKSQIVALLLAVLLFGLGIHRFYLGYTWQGVVQLLTLGGCGIWALIDVIRIVTGDLEPKNGPYDDTL